MSIVKKRAGRSGGADIARLVAARAKVKNQRHMARLRKKAKNPKAGKWARIAADRKARAAAMKSMPGPTPKKSADPLDTTESAG